MPTSFTKSYTVLRPHGATKIVAPFKAPGQAGTGRPWTQAAHGGPFDVAFQKVPSWSRSCVGWRRISRLTFEWFCGRNWFLQGPLAIPCDIVAGSGRGMGATRFDAAPTAFASPPTAFASPPTAFASPPTAFASQPTAFASQPTAFASQPTAFTSQPTEFASQPTEFTSQPTARTSQPTERTSPWSSRTTAPQGRTIERNWQGRKWWGHGTEGTAARSPFWPSTRGK